MAASIGPDLAFHGTTASDFHAWRQRFLPAHRECLGRWAQPAALDAEVLHEVDCASHKRLHLHFNSSPSVTVSAYLLLLSGKAATAATSPVLPGSTSA